MDLSNIIKTSLDEACFTSSTVRSLPSSSETIIVKPGDQRISIPITTNISGTATIQLPSTSTTKEQSLILPADFSSTGGPLLCQLDDNSYVLIEGLDHCTTTSNTCTTSPTKTLKTSPLATVKQLGNTISMKPSTSTTGMAQVKTTPTITTTINKTVTKGLTPSKAMTVGIPSLINKSINQGTTRPTYLVVSNSPITSKVNNSLPTKDLLPLGYTSKSFPVKQTSTNTSTTSSCKFLTNMTTNSAGQNSNAPLKFILVPQPKVNSNLSAPTPSHSSITPSTANTGMKTITINTSGTSFNSQTLHLPVGTTLLPTNKSTTKPTIVKPGITTIIPSSKINLKVPPIHSLGKVQSPQIGSTKTSELAEILDLYEDVPTTSNEIEQQGSNDSPKSPTLFDDVNETLTSGPAKSIITYSKISPKSTVKLSSANEITPKLSSPLNTPTAAASAITQNVANLSSQPSAVNPSSTLPLHYIVPTPSVPSSNTPTAIRKRKCGAKSMRNTKKVRTEQKNLLDPSDNILSIGEVGTKSGDNMVREVIAKRCIQPSDKAIINTAVHELKKLVARRELLLKQLNSSCLALGKVDYKLTISGSPVDTQKIYQGLTSFQERYESDLKNLDWAVSAMHKLYSELAPKNETRTTEEILQDLIGPAEGIVDDPAAKYQRFRTPSSPKKPRVRSPKKQAKKYYYHQGEEGCPAPLFEERKVPDKPDPSDGKFHCELCPKIFLKQISLSKHLEFDHPVSLELEKNMTFPRSPRPKLPHACQNCDKSFHSSIMLSIHRANEHDAMDSYEISRESRTISRRSKNDSHLFSDEDWRSPTEDESKLSKNTNRSNATMTTRNAKSVRRFKKTARRTRSTATTNNNKIKSKHIDSLDFLYDSEATLSASPRHNLRSNWCEVDVFDPDIPIECTDDNPIIPLKSLTPETIAAYTASSRY